MQRQAVEHLFEIDFGAKNIRSFLFPWRAYVRFFQPDPEISTEKVLELAKKWPSSIALATREVTMNLPKKRTMPLHTHFSAAVGNSFGYTLKFASPVREGMNQIRASRFWREASRPAVQKSKMRTVSISSGS